MELTKALRYLFSRANDLRVERIECDIHQWECEADDHRMADKIEPHIHRAQIAAPRESIAVAADVFILRQRTVVVF